VKIFYFYNFFPKGLNNSLYYKELAETKKNMTARLPPVTAAGLSVKVSVSHRVVYFDPGGLYRILPVSL
jgi:hypothetical protein